jgi:hypothetical protein
MKTPMKPKTPMTPAPKAGAKKPAAPMPKGYAKGGAVKGKC